MNRYALENKCGKHQLLGCVECYKKYFAGYDCICDCECKKETNEENVQCDDCDNGIHYDNIRKIYVNYEEDEALR